MAPSHYYARSPDPDTEGLVAWYRMDEGTGTTTAASVVGPTGNLSNSPAFSTFVPTTIGPKYRDPYSMDFRGSMRWVDLQSGNAIPGPWTVCAWFCSTNVGAMAGSQLIIGRYDVAGARREYLFYVYAGALGVQRASAPSYPTVTGPATLTNGVWYHGLATYDGTNGCLYVNGSLVATGSLNVFVNNDPYRDSRIGAWVHSSIGFQGWINDMRLYNVAKTSNQVFKIFGGNR